MTTAVERSNDARIVSRSPQRPADVVLDVPARSPAEVVDLAGRTREAQRAWARATPLTRAEALSAGADAVAAAAAEIAELVTREVGKPQAEAAAEVARTVALLRYFAQTAFAAEGSLLPSNGPAGSFVATRRRPVGIAGLITPWNFPVMIPAWKAAPALAAGNGVLWKPAPAASACALRLAELLTPHLPEHLLQVVPGDGPTGQAVVEASDVISFTGSTSVGMQVAHAAMTRGVPTQAEMGGLNASVVLPDADAESAAAAIASAAMGYAGQKCTATSRVVVVGSNDAFVDALVEAVRRLPMGDPATPDTVVGPVISDSARHAVQEGVQRARSDGGRVLTGGGLRDPGWYTEPVLVSDVGPGSWAAQTEVFGPFCTVLPARTVDEAVEIVNGTRYGLVAALYTGDLDQMLSLPARLRAGLVRVNAPTSGVDFHAPFGGYGESGRGPRELGSTALAFYSDEQTLTVHPQRAGT
jgi:aldehyde dehydrogenase (NAD+)